MALNLNQLANSVAVVEKMYSISIDGVSFGELSETDTEKLIGIIKGMQSGKQLSTTTAPATPKTEVVVKKSSSKVWKNPDLGTPTCTLKGVVAYKSLVRITAYGNARYAIKMAIKEKGGAWDEANEAYKFPTVKACNEFLKAQKAYEESNKK